MQIAQSLKLTILTAVLLCSQLSFATITIDSVVTKPSRCANDGVATIYAQSPSPMLYALISGPEIRPAQSGNQFAALPSGAYLVRIINFSNDTTVVPANIGGTYTFPDFAPTFSEPLCVGTATGIIAGNPINAGTPPFTWVLTDLGTNVTTTQANDTFYNVPAGSYSIRQFDSCQSFATRFVTVGEPYHDFIIGNINNRVFDCDSVELYIQLFLQGGNYALPYTISITTHNGTYQQNIDPAFLNSWYPDLRVRVGGVTYGDYCNFTITDGCGRVQSALNTIAPFLPGPNFNGTTDSCQPKFAAYFSLYDQSDPTVRPTYFHAPVTLVLFDPNTGAVVDSLVTIDTGGYVPFAYTPYRPPGTIYNVRLSDTCGHVYNTTIQMPVLAAPAFSMSLYTAYCLDSTIGVSLRWDNTFSSLPTFELLSGPATIHSTKPRYQHLDTIPYPQQHPAWAGSTTAVGSYLHAVELANVGVGTYRYHIYDSCGLSIIDSFTIRPEDVSDLNYSFTYTRGCPGQNTLITNLTSNVASYSIIRIDGNGIQTHLPYLFPDTLRNLNSGTYYLSVNYYLNNGMGLSITQNNNCTDITETLTIPAYELPKIDYAVQIKCNGTVNVGLLPDSSKGIPPYEYEILSGPQTAAVQPSNFFTLTQPGNYVARIGDVCGFARTFSFSVDTLDFRQIVKIGSSCAGNTATLVAEHSPYATYTWQRPNATLYNGDSLRISPVTPADYGVYQITKIVSVNACRDTFYATYTLTSSSINYTTAAICPGGSIQFDGRTLTQAGTYYDTIPGALCDSIVVLNLSIATPAYDSVSVSICTGQSVTVGSRTYTTTGIYRDTLTTAAGCDSLHVLKLQVTAYLQDSIQRAICSGQTYALGGRSYSTTGIYRDTVQGINGGCDSIHILNLLVNAYKRDSVAQFICYGQSVTVGQHTYTNTGLYRDTLTTNTCDSIHILNLQVGQQKRDSVSRSICSGQSITIGTHTYTTTGIYRDTFNVSGCDSVFILNLQVGAYKTGSATQTICAGEAITIGNHTYTTTGVYRDTFTTATCDSIFTLNLIVNPIQQSSQTLTICNGQSITIGNHTYSATGSYTDTLTAVTGCDSIHRLNLLVVNAKYDSVSIAFCQGDSMQVGNATYTLAGIYTDTLTTYYGCDSIVKVQVNTYPKPVLQISAADSTVEYSDTVRLTATGNNVQAYFWQGNAVFDNAFSPIPLATISQAGWIVAVATSADNCTTTDSLYIAITDCNEAIFIPNAFTPNGDGQNDIFKVLSRCVTLYSFRIFNRWGELVYETSDITQGWDGTFKGAAQMPGVFVYTVVYFANAAVQQQARLLKGSVSLIR